MNSFSNTITVCILVGMANDRSQSQRRRNQREKW
jgi:hypothetical protein